MTDATCAIAASYEAKAYGVQTGTMIYEAKKLCPELICVEANHENYVEYHHKILAEIDKYIPVEIISSIDEVACKLIGSQKQEEKARKLAKIIKIGLQKNIGEYIRCSIGIAPNRFLAKTASNLEKPDGLQILYSKDVPERIKHFKLSDLTGIGRAMEYKLNKSGILSISELYNIPPKHMRKIWGNVQGEKFWYMLRGQEIADIKTERKTIGHSHVLEPKWRNIELAEKVMSRLLLKAASRLRRMNYYSSKLSLNIKTEKGLRLEGKSTFYSACDNKTLLEESKKIWEKLILNDFMRTDFNKNSTKEDLKNNLKTLSKELEKIINTDQTNEVLFDPIFDIEFYDSSYFILSDSMYSDNHVIYPGDTVSVQAIVTNDISDLPSFVLLSGQISLIGNNGISDSTPFLCEYVFAETYLNISNLGCTNPFAINYDSLATIDNGSCLNFITANISLIEPDCQGDFGSAIIYLSGGEPPYNSITLYDSYSQIGLPPENYTINFNSQGVAYLDGLLVGDYNVQVSDNNIIDTMFLFSISPPSSMSVVAYVQPNGVLSSTVFSENPVVYQWLFNGESVIGATQENYSPIAIGQYQVYIEDEFGCGSYSDIVVATISFLDLHEDPINQFSVFPNPTNGIINLKFAQLNNVYDIILTNIFGEELHKYSYYQDNTNVRLDVSYLPSGVYFISTEFNGHRTVKRFTKQNDY